jgi:hypothetical protein
MTTYGPEVELFTVPDVDAPEAGVIRDARRRRRGERLTISLLLLAATGVALFLLGNGTGGPASSARSTRPTWLTGAPLNRPTHLRLLVSENGGPAAVVDVDSGHVRAVPGLGLPRRRRLWSPSLYPLSWTPAGARGDVTRRDCNGCTATQTNFLINANGAVQRTSTLTLAADQYESTPVYGSTSASWVLTHPRSGHCTLRLQPGSRPALDAPCGSLASDTPAGLIIATNQRMLLIDPQSGHTRARSPLHGQLDVLSANIALTSNTPGVLPANLTLINLSTRARMHLRWPSLFRSGYQVFPEPHSSVAAVEFADPAYAGTQAGDVWLLNTRTHTFSHVPGFPILEHLKFSDIAWTDDHRLAVVAQGGGRTAIGIWRPGSPQLRVGTIPALTGYSEFVPFVR